ncbi:MAG TPA: hypothetical protein PKE53_01435 [Flavobacteriales bacterium]|nr:hypothetical protein [Flavobacteriales bacterium]
MRPDHMSGDVGPDMARSAVRWTRTIIAQVAAAYALRLHQHAPALIDSAAPERREELERSFRDRFDLRIQ